jgi:hypothetical protein
MALTANQWFTLKDATAADALYKPGTVGLVDVIVNVAPELDKIPGRIIPGLSYEATVLKALGSNLAFRKFNSGVPYSAPSLDLVRFNTFPLDCQFAIDEGLIRAGEANGTSMAETMAIHASAGIRQEALSLGRQIYQGSLNDPNGPPGFADFLFTQRTQVDSRTGLKIDQAVDAGGTTAGQCEIVWFVKSGPQGVHWLFGNGSAVRLGPWVRLPGQVSPDSTSAQARYNTQWKNNLFGFIGTSMAQVHAIGAITNVNSVQTGTTNGVPTYQAPLTDALTGILWGKWPIGMKPDLCFATQKAIVSLQMHRTVTLFANNPEAMHSTAAMATLAEFPTHLPLCGGIPIIPTDSIVPGNQYILN